MAARQLLAGIPVGSPGECFDSLKRITEPYPWAEEAAVIAKLLIYCPAMLMRMLFLSHGQHDQIYTIRKLCHIAPKVTRYMVAAFKELLLTRPGNTAIHTDFKT